MDFVYGVVTIILTYMAEQCVGQGGKVVLRGCCWQVAACGSTVTSSNRIHCSSVQLTSNNPRHCNWCFYSHGIGLLHSCGHYSIGAIPACH